MNLSILVVDDDPVDREMIKRCLVSLDASITEADTGAKCLELVTDQFDCILLDHFLPDYTSLELIGKIRDRKIISPIIVITGHGDEFLVVKALKAGADHYIPKQKINTNLLLEIIVPLMTSYQRKAELSKKDLDMLKDIQTKMEDILRDG